MVKQVKRKKRVLQKVLIISIISVVLFHILAMYTHMLDDRLNGVIRNNLSELSRQNVLTLETEIRSQVMTIEGIAERIGTDENFSLDKTLQLLKRISQRHTYKRMGIILQNGRAYTTDDAKLDLTGRQFFRASMQGSSVISDKLVDYVDGKDIIVFSTPVESKNEVAAVLFTTYSTDNLREILSIPLYNGKGDTYIIRRDGEIIVDASRPGPGKEGNLFQFLHSQGMGSNRTFEKITSEMKSGSKGVLRYFSDMDRYMQYTPLAYNGWYLISVIPTGVVEGPKHYIMNTTYLLCGLVLLLFGAMLMNRIRMEKKKSKQLSQVLYVDALTGGDSYQKFCEDAAGAVSSSNQKAAMIIMDLDRFKLINELFGQEKGDEALRYIANVWRRWIRTGEMFSRSIADRFVVLAFYDTREELMERVEQFIHILQNESMDEKQGYVFRPSLGIYLVQNKNEDLHSMLNYAAMAYAVAKNESGVYYEIYDERFRESMLNSKILEDQMEVAYKNEEFILYYQPKYGAQDQKLRGAEVLVRWRKEDGSLISPGIFIPAAEESGFIVKLDRYIFQKACEQLRDWQEKGLSLVPVSVNLSREHLRDASFIEEYQKIRGRSGIPAEAVELEITESAMFENQKEFKKIAEELHEIGFRILMDDFGTGYSSLMMLKSIPVDVMKLDKSFVDDYNDPRGEKIINCVVQLAKAMDIQITAEGVETEEQYQYLKGLSCDMIQGYYFARPMPGEEFEKLLERVE